MCSDLSNIIREASKTTPPMEIVRVWSLHKVMGQNDLHTIALTRGN